MRTIQVLPAILAMCLALPDGSAAKAADPSERRAARHESHEGDHATWCGLHAMRGEYQLAIEDCDEAIRQSPGNPQHYSNRGSAYLMANELERAITDFGAGLQIAPEDAALYFNRGLAYAQKGDRQEAIADYTEAIRLRPGLGAAYNNRGYEFELSGERDKAIADYRRALELAPSMTTIRQNLRRLGAE